MVPNKTGETAALCVSLSPLFYFTAFHMYSHIFYASSNVTLIFFPIAAAIFTIKSSDGL